MVKIQRIKKHNLLYKKLISFDFSDKLLFQKLLELKFSYKYHFIVFNNL